MTLRIEGQRIRGTLLEVVAEHAKNDDDSFQARTVLGETARRLGIHKNVDHELEQALLTYWHDLFRTGYLSWGYNLDNPDFPFCHLNEQGRKALSDISKDPSNPDGYLANLGSRAGINDVAKSYIDEAVRTFNANCPKATAVMVGAAAESLVLEIRDTLVDRIRKGADTPNKKLLDWKAKTVLDAIKSELDSRKKAMDRTLNEDFEACWPAFTQQIRRTRNEAGHPVIVDPVTYDSVHAGLLVFPELAALAQRLREWIENNV